VTDTIDAPDGRSRLGHTAIASIADAVASDAPTPGGGAVAGLTAALAAGLLAMVARFTPQTEGFDSASIARQADELRHEAMRLADDDVAAYQAYLDAAALPRDQESSARQAAIRAALDTAAAVPFALAELAAEVARLGEQLAQAGNPRLRSDALTAAQLGGAVATAAAELVRENLRSSPDDPRSHEAERLAATASAAASRTAAPPPPSTTTNRRAKL
jgi:formiminotetrahydrofolate cyclodeaminase